MYENSVFYLVFLSQILLLSFYYPKKIVKQMQQMLTHYPASEYPKLYTKPIEYYRIGQKVYRLVNRIILALGIIVLIAIGRWDISSDGSISEMLPFAFWAIQVIPILMIEILGYANFRLMREADQRTTRAAVLNPRRLFDFVSPVLVVSAALMYVATLLFFYTIHGFQLHPSNDTFVIFISLTLMNLLFIGLIIWNLTGKKKDPHQAHEDRLRQMSVTLKSLFVMSIVAGVFLVTIETLREFDLSFLASSLMSVYLQLTIVIGLGSFLRSLSIEDMNFDVYRADVLTTEGLTEGSK